MAHPVEAADTVTVDLRSHRSSTQAVVGIGQHWGVGASRVMAGIAILSASRRNLGDLDCRTVDVKVGHGHSRNLAGIHLREDTF